MSKNVPMYIQIPEQMRKDLEKFCRLTHRDFSGAVRRGLEQLFEREMPNDETEKN